MYTARLVTQTMTVTYASYSIYTHTPLLLCKVTNGLFSSHRLSSHMVVNNQSFWFPELNNHLTVIQRGNGNDPMPSRTNFKNFVTLMSNIWVIRQCAPQGWREMGLRRCCGGGGRKNKTTRGLGLSEFQMIHMYPTNCHSAHGWLN